jgi:hypothetical protein
MADLSANCAGAKFVDTQVLRFTIRPLFPGNVPFLKRNIPGFREPLSGRRMPHFMIWQGFHSHRYINAISPYPSPTVSESVFSTVGFTRIVTESNSA